MLEVFLVFLTMFLCIVMVGMTVLFILWAGKAAQAILRANFNF